jgi:hypothetical protein
VVVVVVVVFELTVVVSEVLTILGEVVLTMVVLDVFEASTIFAVDGIEVVVNDCDVTLVTSVFATDARLAKNITRELKHQHLM